MNRKFQEYKKCKVELVDDLDIDFTVKPAVISFSQELEVKKEKYDRSKMKKETQRLIDEEFER